MFIKTEHRVNLRINYSLCKIISPKLFHFLLLFLPSTPSCFLSFDPYFFSAGRSYKNFLIDMSLLGNKLIRKFLKRPKNSDNEKINLLYK